MRVGAAAPARWSALALVCLAAGCGPTQGQSEAGAMRTLTGTVLYRERIALPADATVEVRLEDVSIADAPAAVIADQTIATEGRQPPIPFELRYAPGRIVPNRRYAVRASIRAASGELMFTTTEHHGVLTQGGPTADVEIMVQRVGRGTPAPIDTAPDANAPAVGRTLVFDCEGQITFTVRTGPGEAAVWAPEAVGGQYVVLGRVESPTGTRYEDGTTVFVHEGERATFQIAGQTFADCRANHSQVPWADAKGRGVTFRALGNEPAWVLEIFPDRLALVTDLGARRTELPYAEPFDEGTRTTYRTHGGEIVAVIDRAACTDTMSGEPFDATATVMANGTTYRGCGRFL